MTIKTLHKASNLTLEASKSDMQKRGAVRNLFGTTVDRGELQEQLKQLNNENNRALGEYKIESIISENYQPRKLKRYIESDIESDSSSKDDDDEPESVTPSSEPVSSDEPSSSSPQTSSSKKAVVKLVQQRIPLPRGQKTLKGEFHPQPPSTSESPQSPLDPCNSLTVVNCRSLFQF